MVSVSYSHQFSIAQLRSVLTSPQGGLYRDLLRRGLAVETQAKRNLGGIDGPKRIDTGRLRASIHTTIVLRNGNPTALVGTNVKYAILVHDGTGIYGPRHRPIRPRRAKFLRFRPKGKRGFVYAREVKGMKPNAFLRNALRAARR